ncbi:hypothetical protein RHGRI_038666 [Rhododendron griersonianum]|uniref:Uncharacterized protein n=1 Tax=Rhododendron griersonianum TaxID=479676 RepID=A0AAV6HJ08_9ERIC|nr:hypothetical protein RHGRI_038666 [Rhododendron griersonianum]
MAEGTVSFADGLGLKALDSNELRRRQQISEFSHSPQFRPNLTEVGNKKMNISTDFQSEFMLRNAVPTASPSGYGAFSPKTLKNMQTTKTASKHICSILHHSRPPTDLEACTNLRPTPADFRFSWIRTCTAQIWSISSSSSTPLTPSRADTIATEQQLLWQQSAEH